MSKNHLIESFRCCSGPALFLVGVCTAIGILFLSLDCDAGCIFLVAAASALVVFIFLGGAKRVRP